MLKILTSISLASVILLSGCSSTPVSKFSATGDVKLEPLNQGCPITVYITHPKKGFDELGMIDLVSCGHFGCADTMNQVSIVKENFSKHVCEAGGNGLLLWEANGLGIYTKAIVIKTK
mgnify:CR=1 FL=1